MFNFIETKDSTRKTVRLDTPEDLPEFSNWLRNLKDARVDISMIGDVFEGDFIFLSTTDRRNFCDGMDLILGKL
jgi:hypothetical protein